MLDIDENIHLDWCCQVLTGVCGQTERVCGMWYSKCALMLMVSTTVLLSGPGYAQDEADDNDEAAVVEEESETEAADSSDPLSAARAKGGDVIIMKSGAVMGGVQILRSTSRMYEIQIIEGADPLIIPRKQVESVEMDDIDPLRDARRAAKYPDEKPEIRVEQGQEMSEELTSKLLAPIPGAPFEIEDEDYIQVIQRVAQATGVTIVVDMSLRDGLPEDRLWTIKIPAEMKLVSLLQDHWDVKFVDGTIKYELDRVVLHKEGVQPQAPPAQPQPGVGVVVQPTIPIGLGKK